MSTKLVKKPTKLASPKSKKKRCVKNTFDLVQFKKMIGKGLITIHKSASAESKVNAELKSKLLSDIKIISMSGFVSGGILYIFDGVDRLLAINSISYADVKKYKLEIDIIVYQYFHMSPLDMLK